MDKNIYWLYNIYIAHRGLHNISKNIPENSIVAFDEAIKNKMAIELDVHVIKDGTIVVFHDDNLKRCCNIDRKIKDCTLKDIENLRLFNTDYKIPTLADALSYIDGCVPVIIEIKTDMPTKAICPKLADILKIYKGLYAIKSFSPLNVYWFKKNHSNIPRGMLVSTFDRDKKFKCLKKAFITSMIFMPLCKPDFLSLELKMLKSKKIKEIKKEKNICILGWTFRTKMDEITYEPYCDSYICENITK